MADTKEKTKYRLYLMANNKQNLEIARKERFNRINGKYILVYTNNFLTMLHESNYHILDESETRHLSDSEKVWLLEANVKIIAEEAAKNQDEMIRDFEDRLDRLERELAIESEKLNKGQGGQDEL